MYKYMSNFNTNNLFSIYYCYS